MAVPDVVRLWLFQGDAKVRKRALYLLDALGTETFDIEEVVFFFTGKSAYRSNICFRKGINGARGKGEGLNAGLHDVRRGLGASFHFSRSSLGSLRELRHSRMGDNLFLKADNSFELRDHYFDRALERRARRESTVRLNGDAQTIEIGPVADSHILHLIVDAPNRREDGIKTYFPHIDPFLFYDLAWDVAQSPLYPHFYLKRCSFIGKLDEVLIRIKKTNLTGKCEISSRYFFRTCRLEIYRLGLCGQDLEAQLLEIEKDRYHILSPSFECRELVRYSVYFDRRYRGAGERGEYDTTQGIPERMSVTRVEAIYLIHAMVVVLGDHARFRREHYRIFHHRPVVRYGID